MCSKDNLVHGLAASSCIIFFLSAVLMVCGSILVSVTHFHEIFGSAIKSIGGGLIFLSLVYPVAGCLGIYSAKHHNKFLLLVQWLFLVLLVLIQFLLGGLTRAAILPEFPYSFQVSCLTTVELINQTTWKSCQKYFQSDKYAGINLVWKSYYSKSLEDNDYLMIMQTLQRSNFCCGLGAPLFCYDDNRTFPSYLPSNPTFLNQNIRKLCNKANKYLTTPTCNVDESCSYDMPVGTCGNIPAVPETAKGLNMCYFIYSTEMLSVLFTVVQMLCIENFRMMYNVSIISNIVLAITVIPLIFIIMSICLCLKRKDEDVLPPMKYAIKASGKVHVEASS